MSRREMRPPRRFGRIIEVVCARDRQYFEEHPDKQFYVRDYCPGELWPYVVPQCSAVLVRRLTPNAGARSRTPIPNHTAEEVHALLADPRVTVFAPSLFSGELEPLEP